MRNISRKIFEVEDENMLKQAAKKDALEKLKETNEVYQTLN